MSFLESLGLVEPESCQQRLLSSLGLLKKLSHSGSFWGGWPLKETPAHWWWGSNMAVCCALVETPLFVPFVYFRCAVFVVTVTPRRRPPREGSL